MRLRGIIAWIFVQQACQRESLDEAARFDIGESGTQPLAPTLHSTSILGPLGEHLRPGCIEGGGSEGVGRIGLADEYLEPAVRRQGTVGGRRVGKSPGVEKRTRWNGCHLAARQRRRGKRA